MTELRMTQQALGHYLIRLLRGTALVVVAVVQVVFLFISVAAFYKIEALIAIFKVAHITVPEIALLLVSSLSPLIIAVLIAKVVKPLKRDTGLIHLLALSLLLYYSATGLFLLYRVETGFPFDWSFLRYHFADAMETVRTLGDQYKAILRIGCIVAALYYWGLTVLFRRIRALASAVSQNSRGLNTSVIVGGILILVATQVYAENGLVSLILESRETKSEAKSLYSRYYEDSIRRLKIRPTFESDGAINENLFMFHLESVNAELVDDSITPRLLQIAKGRGVLFPRIQAPSIFTILVQESILCSTLPALGINLAESEHLRDDLVCLPRILKEFGFKTLYFHSLPNIHFANTDTLMKAIGFDEWHASDIMKPGDKKLSWGYVEEIFYRRVFEYIARFKGQKLFVYIQANTTNHYPFYNDEEKVAFPQFEQKLPFKMPRTQKERMANSTHIQDYHFGQMFDELFKQNYAKNSHAIVFGDHSFPIGKHEGNLFNINGAFQENFVTSLAVLPAENSSLAGRFVKGKQVHRLYSYLGITPTVLDLYGIRGGRYYGNSFFPELVANTDNKRSLECIVSVQPFSGGYVSVIKFPEKHLFDLKKGMVSVYDLTGDPNEMKPLREERLQQEHLDVLTRCLRSLKDKGVSGNASGDSAAH